MHYNSLYSIRYFVQKYLDPKKPLNVLEVGSFSPADPSKDLILRRYFRDNPNWKFTGMDIAPGRNVDIVSEKMYKYPFKDGEFDVVVSANTMEHVKNIFLWMKELARVSNNLVCVVVPANHPEHKYPIDCWRVYPDGMRFAMEEIAGLEVIECRVTGSKLSDTMGIARKKI